MKKFVLSVFFLLAANAGFALLVSEFKSWDDLIEGSSDIFIARCTATEDMMIPKPTVIFGNVNNSDIEVVSVLKGNGKLGSSHLASLCQPYRGEYFLAFANSFTYQTNFGYSAIEEYRIVPTSYYFRTNELVGKKLNDQIQLILTNRFKDLNAEISRDNDEKLRIERMWNPNAASSNTPPTEFHPSGKVGGF